MDPPRLHLEDPEDKIRSRRTRNIIFTHDKRPMDAWTCDSDSSQTLNPAKDELLYLKSDTKPPGWMHVLKIGCSHEDKTNNRKVYRVSVGLNYPVFILIGVSILLLILAIYAMMKGGHSEH